NEILKRGLKVKWGMKARCDGVTEEMLRLAKRAGCFRIHYGVETSTDEGLKAMDKQITLSRIEETFRLNRKVGIMSIAYFMIGCPHERTRDQILENARFAGRLKADYAVFALYSPYPDTWSYQDGLERGLFKDAWKDFLVNPSLDNPLPTVWEEHFPQEELLECFKIVHRKFYFTPRVLLNALFTLRGWTDLARKVRGGLSLIKLQLLGDFEKHGYLKTGDQRERTNLQSGKTAWINRAGK
ncbi:MAG: radical SAM protein, partial [bacterium]|nr:radical SAM protein [bacterium]